MSRPNRATVDYFPLDCQFSDSIRAIEDIYGNDGFIVWVKLLQKLGRSENHIIDIRTNIAWKLFYSLFKIEETKVLNILDTLSELECIDPLLWQSKVIYSKNFVNRLEIVYKKRTIKNLTYKEILKKYGVSGEKTHVSAPKTTQRNGVSAPETWVSGSRNPQSKVKESKVKEEEYKYSSSSAKKIKLTEEEEEILKNFSKGANRKIKSYTLWRDKVIESGKYIDILKEEKERLKKLERQKAKENIPPPEKIEEEPCQMTADEVREFMQSKVKALPKRRKGEKK